MSKLYELRWFTAVKIMVSTVRVRNFLQIVHTFENSYKCFQMIQENVVNGLAGVLFLHVFLCGS